MHGYEIDSDFQEFPVYDRPRSAHYRKVSEAVPRYAGESRLDAWRSRLAARKWRDARANIMALGLIACVATAALLSVAALVGALGVELWQLL
jgi:hypothetical protein